MRLFGTSGIREIADKDLLLLALKVGLAAGQIYHRVVVASDTRTSSDAVKYSLVSGLLAAGTTVSDAGMVPTPTLAFAARESDAGIMITASHNPPQYNGVKMLNPDGSAFNPKQQSQIEELVDNDLASAVGWEEIKSIRKYSGAAARHIERIRKGFPDKFKLKVVVDCACGAASVISPYLLQEMGCEVTTINCNTNGFFPHPVEPTEANLSDLIRITGDLGADLGIAHDGDSDRMMAVDDKGNFIPGDKLLVLFAREAGAKTIVTTIDASMAIDETGLNVIRTSVGDNYISEELKKGGKFGGEPSGSWIFPEISLCPDGLYAAAKLVSIASRQKLSRLLDDIPCYTLLRDSISSEGVEISRLESHLKNLKPLSVSNSDGIKLNFEDGWLLVRPSGTEPKIRVTAEGKTRIRASELRDVGIRIIKECRGDKEK
ncbi:phosphoglucosamine mutase [Chloroflexota bacterium]